MEYVITALCAVIIILLIVLIFKKPPQQDGKELADEIIKETDRRNSALKNDLTGIIGSVGSNTVTAVDSMGRLLIQNQTAAAQAQNQMLRALKEENSKQLEQIRGTVDEKLQTTLEKRITESFRTVSDRLEEVYKGLGEMQTLASDVGGLKKVLSGVKTRGILGEYQLGAILEEILAAEQYETNVNTVPDSRERVEFAVRLPGPDGTVYLPIDSKFPGDSYARFLEARDSGDKAAAEEAYKALENTLRNEAKDIRDKYVSVPYTTNFGIMFLPVEGLYAEVVSRGLLQKLQKEYSVSITGPGTMAAFLNSLQMGFKTLAIQKRSNEVWKVLGEVKSEFETFEKVMEKMKGHLRQTSDNLDELLGVRTRAINRKLKNVEKLGAEELPSLLTAGFDEGPDSEA